LPPGREKGAQDDDDERAGTGVAADRRHAAAGARDRRLFVRPPGSPLSAAGFLLTPPNN